MGSRCPSADGQERLLSAFCLLILCTHFPLVAVATTLATN
jgi:hypothetical protein